MRVAATTWVHCPVSGRVVETALNELAGALGAGSSSGLRIRRRDDAAAGSILLTCLQGSPAAARLAARGILDRRTLAPGADAYQVRVYRGCLLLVGSTPRGLLHAVYALQDALAGGGRLPAGYSRRGRFGPAHRIFHQRFDGWPGTRADIRVISRIGATHCLVSHDWQAQRNFQQFVASPLLPNAVDAGTVERNHADLKRLLADCADYGLEACLWMTEFPCQGGPWVPEATRASWLTRFPAGYLSDSGTYQGKVLCFGRPEVRAAYVDLLDRFFRDFPEISILFVFGLDSGGEFCDPVACPRCRGLSKFEQRDRLLRFLVEQGRRVRPGLRVLTTAWGWETLNAREFMARQAALPAASGLFMAAETDGWQPERQIHDSLREARRICHEQGQLFIGYDDFHFGDDTVHGMADIQDYPLGIAAKLDRWRALGVDGVFDHWGAFNRDISCNSMMLRECFQTPRARPEAIAARIADRQFGPAAGRLVASAWRELEVAHVALSDACTWPPAQWPMWYAGREHAPVPAEWPSCRLTPWLPPKRDGAVVYNGGSLADQLQRVRDAWRAARPHYAAAARHLRVAAEVAEDAPLGYAAWWSGASPTRRTHIQRQLRYVESMGACGAEIGIHLGLQAIWERSGGDPARYRAAAADMLREDANACREAANYFDSVHYPDWPAQYRAKAAAIEAYLASP